MSEPLNSTGQMRRAAQSYYQYKRGFFLCNCALDRAILIGVALFTILGSQSLFAATVGTFNQHDWGSATANNATHPGNQNSWTDYSSKDATIDIINSGADLDLGTETSSITHTSDTDFLLNSDQSQTHTTQEDFSVDTALTDTLVTYGGVVVLNPTITTPLNWVDGGFQPVGLNTYNRHDFELGDLDGDGLYDILTSDATARVRRYTNTGTVSAPSWTYRNNWNPLGWGEQLTVDLHDLDGDGDLDIVHGRQSNNHPMGFENTGSETAFSMLTNAGYKPPYRYPESRASHAFYDFDGDGNLDVLKGESDGIVYFYRNTGTPTAATWEAAPASWSTNIVDVGSWANPEFVDLNMDGKMDLIIGTGDGTFHAYRNAAANAADIPVWTRDTSWEGNPDNTVIDVGSIMSPSFADLDNDGTFDFVAGNNEEISSIFYNKSADYPLSGTFESAVIDAGVHSEFKFLNFTVETEALVTDVTFDVRAGNTPSFDGSWMTLTNVLNGGDISALVDRRYVQYVATLTTTDTAKTPKILDVTISYMKLPWGDGGVIVAGNGIAGAVELAASLSPVNMGSTNAFNDYRVTEYYKDNVVYSMYDQQLAWSGSMAKLTRVNVENPAAPSASHNATIGSHIHEVTIDGDYAYVGLDIGLNITDLITRTTVSTTPMARVEGVAVNGDLAYLAARTDGVQIVDVSDRTEPVVISSYDMPGEGYGNAVRIYYHEDYLYVIPQDGTGTAIVVLNVTYPEYPTFVSAIATGSNNAMYDFAVYENTLYVTSENGLRVYDISDPSAPTYLRNYADYINWYHVNLRVQGQRLYAGQGNTGLKVLDLSVDPERPTLLLEYSGAFFYRFDVFGNYAYTNGFQVVRLGDYVTSGDYYSSIIDTGQHLGLTTLDYNALVPANTGMAVDVRAGNSINVNDASWTDWSAHTAVVNGADISALGDRRYVQYRLRMTSSDVSLSPSLRDISINYATYVESASLVSSPYNTTDANNLMGALSWSETLLAGTDVRLQLRTAVDVAGDWSEWQGPDGTPGTFWNSANTHSSDCSGSGVVSCVVSLSSMRDTFDDQWVQYRVTLVSNYFQTPVVSSVGIGYDEINVAGGSIVVNNLSGASTGEPNSPVTFDVSLGGGAPSADVTIALLSTNVAEGTLSTSLLTFTPSDWAARTVTVTGVDDDVADGDIAYQIQAAASNSSDASYDDVVVIPVDLTNVDDDEVGITLTPESGSTSETGGTRAFTAVLDTKPLGNVRISLESSNEAEGTLDIYTLIFTPDDWNIPQPGLVTGVDDFGVDPDTAYSILITMDESDDPQYAAYEPPDLLLTNGDDDIAGVAVRAYHGYSVREGAVGMVTFKLTSKPKAAVVLGLSLDSAGSSEAMITAPGLFTASLIFSPENWDTYQTVTLLGLSDFIVDGDVTFTLVTADLTSSGDSDYDGLVVDDVSMTSIDAQSYSVFITPETGLVTTEKGGSDAFSITLGSAPDSDVTIHFGSDDPSEGIVSPAFVTFPGGNAPMRHLVTVTGLADRELDDDVSYTIETTMDTLDSNYSLIDPVDVSVINTDSAISPTILDPDSAELFHGASGIEMADINCDGIQDMLVTGELRTGSDGNDRWGELSLYYGNGTSFSAERDGLISAAAEGGRFAFDVVNLGDINGDSCDDIAVTEDNGYIATYTKEGRVHVYYGSATGFADANSDGISRESDAEFMIIKGTQSGEGFGSIMKAFDMDNDDDLDLLMRSDSRTYILENDGSGFLWADGDADNVIKMTENTYHWAFDFSVSSIAIGNFNGDLYLDIAMGYSDYANGQTYEGAVYVFYGSATGFSDADSDDVTQTTDADWMAESDSKSARFGSSVANAGDLFGDGADDLLVGARLWGVPGPSFTYKDYGAAFLFHGANPGGLVTASAGDGIVRATSESDWNRIGTAVGGEFVLDGEYGRALGAAGDFNGDGARDIIIGQPGNDRAYIYLNTGAAIDTTPFFIHDDGTASGIGANVGTLGDINGDSFSDLYITASQLDNGHTDEGGVYLLISDHSVPGVTVNAAANLKTHESGTTATFTVVLDAPFGDPSDTLTIDVSSLDTDEGTVSPALLSFDYNNWNVPQIVTATGVNDLIVDGEQPYTIELAAVVSTDLLYDGNIDPVDVVIGNQDDDNTDLVTVYAVSAFEGGAGSVRFLRSGDTADALTIDYAVSGTATFDDYVSLGTSVVIPADETEVTIAVATINDAVIEADETVIVTLLPGSGYSFDSPDFATITINNDDVASIVVSPLTTLVTTESGGSATFTVRLATKPDDDVTVGLSSSNGGEGVVTPGELVFTADNYWSEQTVTVFGVDDGNTIDSDVTYYIETAPAVAPGDTNYNTMDAVDVEVVNRDNDNGAIPRVTLSATNPIINEAVASGLFTVSRSGPITSSLRVFYSVAGTAWPNADYIVLPGSIDIPVGASSYTVVISPIQDAAIEGDETLVITLAPASDYVIDQPSRETIILVDDDTAAVAPFANFAIDQSVGEGGSITVGVELSDSALSYPVTIPYSITGTAENPADHDAADGSINIVSGTSGSVTVAIVDDGAGDAGETIIVTMGEPINARQGLRTTHTVTTVEANEVAEVAMTAVQNSQDTRLVIKDDGNVVVTAMVSDPNPADTHTYDWSASNGLLTDIPDADDTTFVFDPSGVDILEGFYKVRLKVTDNGINPDNIIVDSELLLEIVTTAPTLSTVDSDNDGVPDNTESFIDSDGDGLADYLDASILLSNELQLFASQTETYIMRTEAGLTLRLGDVAFAAEADGAYVTSGDISAFGGGEGAPGAVTAPDSVPNSGGYVDFEIAELPNAGQSVNIVIPQLTALPAGAVYRKYHPDTGWASFVQDANNQVASAAGLPGICPPPGSAEYSAGLTAGHYCIQLTIQDGSSNDMDGQANRVIKDPAQIGKGTVVATQNDDTSTNSSDSSSSSGSTGGGGAAHPLWLLVMVMLWQATIRQRRRNY